MSESLVLWVAVLCFPIAWKMEYEAKIRLRIPIRASYRPLPTYLAILFCIAVGCSLIVYPLVHAEPNDFLTKMVITLSGVLLLRAGVLWEAIPIIVGVLNRGQSSLSGMGDSPNQLGETNESMEEEMEADKR